MADSIAAPVGAPPATDEKKTPSIVVADESPIEYNVSASTLAKTWSKRALYIAFTW